VALAKEVLFVTAHPCAPSAHVRFVKSPSSPTIQQIDVADTLASSRLTSVASVTGEFSSVPGNEKPRLTREPGHPLHKFYTYTVMNLSELIERRASSLEDLLLHTNVTRPSLTPAAMDTKPRVLVIDCITNFAPPPPTVETPTSPVLDRKSDGASPAAAKMHLESRRRQFGSDMEILVRAICAEKGWNAIISRRRRGCLACAIREAGALSWKVVIRVD